MKKQMTQFLVAALGVGSAGLVAAQEHDHSAMTMDMQMQGGNAPADARDPDAYSGGQTLHSGPYLYDGKAGHSDMQMGDESNFAVLMVERLESTHSSTDNATVWDMQARFGNAYDKAVLKSEGDASQGKLGDARTELLWSHAISTFWDAQAGVRNDSGSDRPSRNWFAFGVQGLAPYWFDVEATAYVGPAARTAFRFSASYDLLLTQRLILQPRLEANLYGERDAEANIGSGLSNGSAGLRLRYEITRQFAPYIGVERAQYFGSSADLIEAAGGNRGETRAVAGVRLWF